MYQAKEQLKLKIECLKSSRRPYASYLLVALGWARGTGAEHVSMWQNKSQLAGKAELQKALCLYCSGDQIWTNPQLDQELLLYIPRAHPSQSDQYIIITPSLLLNGLDAMDQAS